MTTTNIFRNKSIEITCLNLGYVAGRPFSQFMSEAKCAGYMFRGWGSFVHGHTVEVSNPRYGWVTITEHKWSYDYECTGFGVDYDTKESVTLRIADAIVKLATIAW